jgi:hypothetical protein
MAELDEDALALGADQVDLVDPRDGKELLARVLAEVLQSVEAGEHVEDGVDVAILVVDVWAEHALRQAGTRIIELLAGLVEEVGHPLRRGVVAEGDRVAMKSEVV